MKLLINCCKDLEDFHNGKYVGVRDDGVMDASDGDYEKPIKFCPWCGKELEYSDGS